MERAAPGLADAKVREVTAAAIEKEGMAQAKVIAESCWPRPGRAGKGSGRGAGD